MNRVNQTENTLNNSDNSWLHSISSCFNRFVDIFDPVEVRIDTSDRDRHMENVITRQVNKLQQTNDALFNRKISIINEMAKASSEHSLLVLHAYKLVQEQEELQIRQFLETASDRANLIYKVDYILDRVVIKSYDELQELPSDITYDKSIDTCPISLELLKKGDTVYCEKQLYSYESLRSVKTIGNGLVPHSRTQLHFSKNVYKLSNHGVA